MKKKFDCKRFRRVALSDKHMSEGNVQKRVLTRLRCKQWDCAYCASMNRKAWRRALVAQLDGHGKAWSFWTITLPAYVRDIQDDKKRSWVSAQIIKDNWDKVMKRLKRKFGAFQYLRVIEQHKDGVLHIHMLVNIHVENLIEVNYEIKRLGKTVKRSYHYRDDLKTDYTQCGFGYQMDIKNLNVIEQQDVLDNANARNVTMYVTKYMTKEDSNSLDAMKAFGVRRIQTSRGIKSPDTLNKKKSELKWTVNGIGFTVQQTVGEDFFTLDAQEGEKLTEEDFTEQYYYPEIPAE